MARPASAPPQQAKDGVANAQHDVVLPEFILPEKPDTPGGPDDLDLGLTAPALPELPEQAAAEVVLPNEHVPDFVFGDDIA